MSSKAEQKDPSEKNEMPTMAALIMYLENTSYGVLTFVASFQLA